MADNRKGNNVKRDTVRKESTKSAAVRKDNIRRDTVKKDSVRREPVKSNTVRRDAVKWDNTRNDNVKKAPVRRDNVKSSSMKTTSWTEGNRDTYKDKGMGWDNRVDNRADMRRRPQTGSGSSLAGMIVVILIIVLVAAYFIFGSTAHGQGISKSITITVTDDTGTNTVYESETEAEYLIDAVNEIKSLDIQGQEDAYGLFIYSINGVTADYSVDQSYWAIYVNGEYGNYGIDTQPVADGDEFAFVYEISAD